MGQTHIFKLLSGPECEIRKWTVKQQEDITRQDNVPMNKKTIGLIKACLVRVGSVTDITDDFITKLLGGDKKKILVVARQFSLGFQTDFTFQYEYKDDNQRKQLQSFTIPLDEKGEFPERTLKVWGKPVIDEESEEVQEVDTDKEQWIDATYREYSEIERYREYTLPEDGRKVRWTLLDGVGEAVAAATKKGDRTSSLYFAVHNVVYFQGEKKTPIRLDVSKLSLTDGEALRKAIFDVECDVDTAITIEHPQTQKEVQVDALGVPDFFFPSHAI